MTDRDVRGSWIGLLALLGRLVLLLWLMLAVVNLGVALTSPWGAFPYSLAFGLGLCQLVLVLHGRGRLLAGVRRDRALEYPAGREVRP